MSLEQRVRDLERETEEYQNEVDRLQQIITDLRTENKKLKQITPINTIRDLLYQQYLPPELYRDKA